MGISLAFSQGGPPLHTDDPGTPGDGNWEINLAAETEKGRDAWLLEAPLVDINYGLGDRLQLKLEAPWVFVHQSGEGVRNGLGNSTVGVKWRFLDEKPYFFDLSVYPQVELKNPTSAAGRGIVQEGTELILPFQPRRSFGSLALNPELGLAILEEGEEILGLAAGYEILPETFEIIGEIRDVAETDFGDDELVFQLGCRWAIKGPFTFLLTAGRSLRDSSGGEPEFIGYLGVQIWFERMTGKKGSTSGKLKRDNHEF